MSSLIDMSSFIDWFVAFLFRWLPRSAPTGPFPVGHPDRDSPVLLTANFSLTLSRVKRALRGQNVWLLVANSQGINVWCAACGGIFTHARVIDAIEVSGLAERVDHREVILPALSAPGMDLEAIRAETGFRARFGPIYARDIPAYLEAGKKKTERMQRFEFGSRHRIDMFLSMNFPIYLMGALVLAIFWREYLLGYTILFWSALGLLYLLVDVLPGKTGWAQAFFSASLCALLWAGIDWYRYGDPLAHWGWLIALFAVFLAAGFDLAGTASARRSDAEMVMKRLGPTRFGSLFRERGSGQIQLVRDRCRGCGRCREICPVGVYGGPDANGKIALNVRDCCFACGACVKQCPQGALSLG